MCISKAQETLVEIIESHKGEEMVDQYYVDGYGIDLYFSPYKLAVECDEFGRNDRDIGYEVKLQKDIWYKLGCKLICYNPHGKDFSIFKVINQIYQFLQRKV